MDVAALLDRVRARRDYAGQIEHVEVLWNALVSSPSQPRRCQSPSCGSWRPAASSSSILIRSRRWRRPGPVVIWSWSPARPAARRCATTCRSWKRPSPMPTPGPCICSRPRPWRRTSSRVCWSWLPATRTGRAIRPRRVRRRHAHRPAPPHSGRGQSGALEPRHAARLDPALPSEVGRVLHRPALRRDRRNSHLSRHPRGPRVGRAPPAGSGLRTLRLSTDVFLAASATIANPASWPADCIGREVDVVDDDGSPRGRKYFALWNPTPLGNDSLARRSANDDAVMWLVEAHRSRRPGAGLHAHAAGRRADPPLRHASDLMAKHSQLADKVRAYRGGYLPNERREIEQDLFSGNLRGVAATNALELGIDIGSLDVALLVGYPGTIASTWQQAGRSGRRHDESLAVLLAGNDPVDQYLLRHPDYFFAQSPEHAVVDPDNPVRAGQASARPRRSNCRSDEADVDTFGALAGADRRRPLRRAAARRGGAGSTIFSGGQNPAVGVSLRHMSDNTFSIVLVEEDGGSRRREVLAAVASSESVTRPRGDRQRRRDQRPGAGLSRGRLPAQRRDVLCPRARPQRQGGLRRTPRDRLLHAGRARKQRRHHRPARDAATPCRGPRWPTATWTSAGRPWRSRRSSSPPAKTSASGRSTFRRRHLQTTAAVAGARRSVCADDEGRRSSRQRRRRGPAQPGDRRAAAASRCATAATWAASSIARTWAARR